MGFVQKGSLEKVQSCFWLILVLGFLASFLLILWNPAWTSGPSRIQVSPWKVWTGLLDLLILANFFWGEWGYRAWTQGLHPEPLHQHFFGMGFFKTGSWTWAGSKLQSYWSLPPEYLGLKAWATSAQLWSWQNLVCHFYPVIYQVYGN
jgi:hypothetical protein